LVNIVAFGKYCCHLVYFMIIGCIFPRFVILYPHKSGNPDLGCRRRRRRCAPSLR
jgi:hypothetical protein